ncbi:hypothetical protein [Catalinimonas niigatensis]|uniref:hypothetical protein n=1 Tax=Catalinimonas niigatensis TaxID=1397264 RepID=UPI0026668DFB|nr:hypothetical protein [Catalinimonas niigatensis]WPP49633.1 hypothetical protein PZB72_23445 [Catalinimonas niigatensis]
MLRKTALEKSLSGTQEKLIRRRLVARRIRVESKGAYKTAYLDTDGHRVVGAYILQKVYVDQSIKAYRRYFGVGASGQSSEAFVRSLDSDLIQSKIGQVSVHADLGQHIYIAQPVEAGLPVLSYNGLQGGFNAPLTVSVSDAQTGAVMDYYLFESVNDNLGQTTIEIE